MSHIKELNKIAKEISELPSKKSEKIANEIYDVTDELLDKVDNVADEVESLEHKVNTKIDDIFDNLDEVADEIEELGQQEKTAALLNPGDRIVNLNPIQGVYKGRVYLLKEYTDDAKNFGVITEIDQTPVGIFELSRFCLDNKE